MAGGGMAMEPTEMGFDQVCIMSGVLGHAHNRPWWWEALGLRQLRIDIVSQHGIGSAGEGTPLYYLPK